MLERKTTKQHKLFCVSHHWTSKTETCIPKRQMHKLTSTEITYLHCRASHQCSASHVLLCFTSTAVCLFRFDLVEIKHMQNKNANKVVWFHAGFKNHANTAKLPKTYTYKSRKQNVLLPVPLLNCTLSGDRRTFEPSMHEFLRNLVP